MVNLRREYYESRPQLLRRLLVVKPDGIDSLMYSVVAQGTELPDVRTIVDVALAPEDVTEQEAEALRWIGRTLRPELLPKNLKEILLAVPHAVGEDALVAAWETNRQILQLVVTQERIHILVSGMVGPTTPPLEGKLGYALSVAAQILQLKEPVKPAEWQTQTFGGLLLGYREYEYFRLWEHSMTILTDGKAVKLSFRTAEGQTSPPQRVAPFRKPPPWFVKEP